MSMVFEMGGIFHIPRLKGHLSGGKALRPGHVRKNKESILAGADSTCRGRDREDWPQGGGTGMSGHKVEAL